MKLACNKELSIGKTRRGESNEDFLCQHSY